MRRPMTSRLGLDDRAAARACSAHSGSHRGLDERRSRPRHRSAESLLDRLSRLTDLHEPRHLRVGHNVHDPHDSPTRRGPRSRRWCRAVATINAQTRGVPPIRQDQWSCPRCRSLGSWIRRATRPSGTHVDGCGGERRGARGTRQLARRHSVGLQPEGGRASPRRAGLPAIFPTPAPACRFTALWRRNCR